MFQKYRFQALLWKGLGNWKTYKVSCAFPVKITFYSMYKFSEWYTLKNKCTYFQHYFYLKMYCSFLSLLWLIAKVYIMLLRRKNRYSATFSLEIWYSEVGTEEVLLNNMEDYSLGYFTWRAQCCQISCVWIGSICSSPNFEKSYQEHKKRSQFLTI